MVEIESGKHEGKRSEIVALNYPHYGQWYRGKYPQAKLSKTLQQHAAKMDAKPFTVACDNCKIKAATRATAYQNNPDLYFWCADCDPYSLGASRGKLSVVNTCQQALDHIDLTAAGNVAWKKRILRTLAQAKGLPKRVGDAQAISFFL